MIPEIAAYWHKKKKWVGVPLYHIPKRLIENGAVRRFRMIFLDSEEPLICPPKNCQISITIQESIIPWCWPEKRLRQLCIRNAIPLQWVTGHLQKKSRSARHRKNRSEERKCACLNSKEFRKMLKHLGKISRQSLLIAQILWFLNKSLGRAGGFVTCEELLRLKTQDVDIKENAPTCISLLREALTGPQIVCHFLPQYLAISLCRQMRQGSPFIFSSRHGGPLLPNQIDAHLQRAGKAANFKAPITSISLRPCFDDKKTLLAEQRAKRCTNPTSAKHYERVSSSEWINMLKKIPQFTRRRGAKSQHDPRDLLNAIFYHLEMGCSIRKLPQPPFPPWRAVDSQYRRWQREGLFEEILRFLEEV